VVEGLILACPALAYNGFEWGARNGSVELGRLINRVLSHHGNCSRAMNTTSEPQALASSSPSGGVVRRSTRR
jgi:hypothetical protein